MRIPIENVEMQQLSFLWYPFVPFGVPTVFQGPAGYGKTTIISMMSTVLLPSEGQVIIDETLGAIEECLMVLS